MSNRVWRAAVVALFVVACGNSKQEPIYLNPDAGGGRADASIEADATHDATTTSDAEPQPGPEPRSDLEVLLLDEEVTFVDGVASRVAVNVPEDTVSLTVSVSGDSGNFFGLSRWVDGNGETLVPSNWVDTEDTAPSICLERTCPVQFASSQSSFAAQLPNNEKLVVAPGSHSIDAYAYTMAGLATRPAQNITATVRVVAKRLPAPPEHGVLNINFYFTGARGWTAATAPTDGDFQEIVQELGAIYEQVNVDIGTLTYNDIPEEFGVLENALFGSDIEELFELSENAPRDAINVFMIEQIFALNAATGNQFGVILGISGGIPGPPFVGTRRSGVVISSEGDPSAPIPTSAIIAHEMGHHLGLFHTSEAQPGMHDPIADTPQNDTSQLMHASGSGTILTPTQGMVMRHNVWVHHEETP